MSEGTKTVLEFQVATNVLESDIAYIIRGVGTDRDKKVTWKNIGIWAPQTGHLALGGGAAEDVHIDADGNVGIGITTLDSWDAALKSLQIGGNASIFADAAAGAGKAVYFVQNVYDDGVNKYQNTDRATRYYQKSGEHFFDNANSGSADSTITWKSKLKITKDDDKPNLINYRNGLINPVLTKIERNEIDLLSGRYRYPITQLSVEKFILKLSAADNNWVSVCWSPELSLFCAVASSGTGDRVMTSPDGITWTIRTSAADNNWRSVCWSPELSLFCAVANTGTGTRVMTSPDGITWTTRTSAADNDWYSVCWSPELSLFCAVAYSGTGDRVMTSPDGITWTIRTSAADNNWRSVCWSPELSLFCAVAVTGTGTSVMTSPDGITWTTRTSAADNEWFSVCWSPELSLFCAVAYSGTGNRVMTSPDGITWTIRTSAADNQWYSVCWSPELSLFCSVAATGTGNRVMTSQSTKNFLGN